MKGISQEELIIIEKILTPFKKKYEFFAYGSRVKGNYRELSDLDIMIKGKNPIEVFELEEIKENFDNSNLSYVVNLVDYFSISESFYNIIKDDLRKI